MLEEIADSNVRTFPRTHSRVLMYSAGALIGLALAGCPDTATNNSTTPRKTSSSATRNNNVALSDILDGLAVEGFNIDYSAMPEVVKESYINEAYKVKDRQLEFYVVQFDEQRSFQQRKELYKKMQKILGTKLVNYSTIDVKSDNSCLFAYVTGRVQKKNEERYDTLITGIRKCYNTLSGVTLNPKSH